MVEYKKVNIANLPSSYPLPSDQITDLKSVSVTSLPAQIELVSDQLNYAIFNDVPTVDRKAAYGDPDLTKSIVIRGYFNPTPSITLYDSLDHVMFRCDAVLSYYNSGGGVSIGHMIPGFKTWLCPPRITGSGYMLFSVKFPGNLIPSGDLASIWHSKCDPRWWYGKGDMIEIEESTWTKVDEWYTSSYKTVSGWLYWRAVSSGSISPLHVRVQARTPSGWTTLGEYSTTATSDEFALYQITNLYTDRIKIEAYVENSDYPGVVEVYKMLLFNTE